MLDRKSLLLFGNYLISNQINNGPSKGFIKRYQSSFSGGKPYPEITGYAISSFSKLYDLEKDDKYLKSAILAANALIRFQNDNGCIPTVISDNGDYKNMVHIFDLAIIARGLLDLYGLVGEKKYLNSAQNIIKFIEKYYINNSLPSVVNLQGEKIKSDFPRLFWINTKVIIPLYQLNQINGNKSLLKDAKKIYETLVKQINSLGFFTNPENPAYNRSHYLAYALYGISYLHKWTGKKEYLDVILLGVNFLKSLMTEEGGIYSEYLINGSSNYVSGYDVPVSAQLAELIIYLNSVGEKNQDDSQLLEKLENFIKNKTITKSWNKKLIGGLPFLEKNRIFSYTVPWGVEFSIHYIYDKNHLIKGK